MMDQVTTRQTGDPRGRVAALVAVAVLVLLTGCDVYAPSWSTIHADGRNSDYSPVHGATDLTLAWQRSFGGNLTVGATVGPDGRVYLTGSTPGCQLQVLDGATGETIWCSGEVNYFAVISSPLIDRDGRIFVADNEAMHAFDHDGTLLWETPIEGAPLSAQFTQNGRVIFITHIGRIYVLHRETGAPVLPVHELTPGATYDPSIGFLACARGTADCPSANTLGIDIDTGVFVFTYWAPGEPQAAVRAMRITEDPVPSLTPLWTNDTLPGGSASSPTISADGERVYVNDNVGSVHALDMTTGAGHLVAADRLRLGREPVALPGGADHAGRWWYQSAPGHPGRRGVGDRELAGAVAPQPRDRDPGCRRSRLCDRQHRRLLQRPRGRRHGDGCGARPRAHPGHVGVQRGHDRRSRRDGAGTDDHG